MGENQYVCSVDVGGTFTDCVLVDDSGQVTIAKAMSTHTEGLEQGFFRSINKAAKKEGYVSGEIFQDIVRIAHGSTIATNAVVEDRGAKTGLLTTKGHEDTVVMMRGLGRPTGEPPERRTNVFIDKPEPVVPRELIHGIPERMDAQGEVVVSLDESAVREAVRDLVAQGVDAIAVSFLWSFQNSEHERRVAEIITKEAPEVFVSCSSEISPSLGEYERSVATCINSLVGPETSTYLNRLTEALRSDAGFDGAFYVMQSNGGTGTVDMATRKPIGLIGSGPAGGIRGCERLVQELTATNLIVTDMGGTSFELGLIPEGKPLVETTPVIKKYQYNLPKLDVKSIGAGGGSIAWIEDGGEALRVGPESAGADPGPACYGLGGDEPTVTDADLLLGYIDPDAEFGASVDDRRERATEALEPLANRLGLTVLETAKGVFDVINAKMADLAKQEVIGRGYDPREFAVVSYGGAGPVHAAAYAAELGVETVIVPGKISPVWSAYGISQSDVRYQLEQEVVMFEPFDPERILSVYDDLTAKGQDLLMDAGIEPDACEFQRVAKMQYEGQLNQLEIPVPSGELGENEIEKLVSDFEEEYTDRYSEAAHLPGARPEIVSLRAVPIGHVTSFDRHTAEMDSAEPPAAARKTGRDAYLGEADELQPVEVYDGTRLHPGNEIDGPTIIDLPHTSIVVQQSQEATINEYNDVQITF